MTTSDRALDVKPAIELKPATCDVTVIIVATNEIEAVQRCLRAVYAEHRVSMEVVVVDNASTDGLSEALTTEFPRARIGDFDVDLFAEFFQGFVNHAKVTLHIDVIRGDNAHHIAETVFKAFGRAVRMALEFDPRMEGILPSTKGSL